MALVAVNLQVQAVNLAVLAAGFIVIGLANKLLLMFYPDRAEARRAAAKFTLVWGPGDAALILTAERVSGLLASAEAAARAIPSVFPLEATVAVNPFLGQAQEDLATA